MIFCTFLHKKLKKVDEIYGSIIGVARGGDFGVTYRHPIKNVRLVSKMPKIALELSKHGQLWGIYFVQFHEMILEK